MPIHSPKTVFRFKPGRVVEIAHDTKGFGYLIAAFHRPRTGKFFSLIKQTYETPIADENLAALSSAPQIVVWLNTYQLLGRKGEAEFRRRGTLESFEPPNPKFWFGSDGPIITLKEVDRSVSNEKVALPLKLLELEMERRGYVHEVRWLPISIVEFLFESRPLRWSAHKKY
jgi:hypothetical protein